MPTSHPLFVEPDEEITSVIDRLKNVSDERLVLVVPRGSVIIQSLMNLKLLVQVANTLNKSLGLVTQDSVGRQLAHRAGLAIYESVDSAEPVRTQEGDFTRQILTDPKAAPTGPVVVKHFQEDERRPAASQPSFKTTASRPNQFWRPALKLVIPMLVGLSIYILLTPKSQITIKVAGESIEREHSITTDPSAAAVSPDNLLIPGELVEETAETTQQFPATGKKNAGDKAIGKVTITNRTGEDVNLPINSKLKSSTGLVYLTNLAVTVKAAIPKIDASGQLSALPGQATTEAVADQPGEQYNSSAPSSLTIVDLAAVKQDKISAEASAFQGGSTKELTVVSADDIDNGRRSTRTNLDQLLKDQAVKKSNQKTILDGAFVTEVIDEQLDHAAGDETNQVSLKLKGKVKALAFNDSIFQKTLVELVRKNLPDNQDVALTTQDQITAVVQSIDFDQKKLIVRGKLSTRVIPKIDQNRLKKSLVGRTTSQAQTIIQKQPQVKDVIITLSPAWYPRLPYLSSRLIIQFDHD